MHRASAARVDRSADAVSATFGLGSAREQAGDLVFSLLDGFAETRIRTHRRRGKVLHDARQGNALRRRGASAKTRKALLRFRRAFGVCFSTRNDSSGAKVASKRRLGFALLDLTRHAHLLKPFDRPRRAFRVGGSAGSDALGALALLLQLRQPLHRFRRTLGIRGSARCDTLRASLSEKLHALVALRRAFLSSCHLRFLSFFAAQVPHHGGAKVGDLSARGLWSERTLKSAQLGVRDGHARSLIRKSPRGQRAFDSESRPNTLVAT